jgi:hypothetical protein
MFRQELYRYAPRLAGKLDLLCMAVGRLDIARWTHFMEEALVEAVGSYGFLRAA